MTDHVLMELALAATELRHIEATMRETAASGVLERGQSSYLSRSAVAVGAIATALEQRAKRIDPERHNRATQQLDELRRAQALETPRSTSTRFARSAGPETPGVDARDSQPLQPVDPFADYLGSASDALSRGRAPGAARAPIDESWRSKLAPTKSDDAGPGESRRRGAHPTARSHGAGWSPPPLTNRPAIALGTFVILAISTVVLIELTLRLLGIQ